MARTKAWFITPAILLSTGVVGYALWQYWTVGTAAWGWTALAAAPFPIFISVLLLTRPVARTSSGLWSVLVPSLAGTSSAFLFSAPPVETLLATTANMIALLYVFWYSRLGRRRSPKLRVGATLPQFYGIRSDGEGFDSKSLADRPAVWMFYRGNWCPLCVAQVRELAERYRELADFGASVVLVSPQPQQESASLSKRFDAPMTFVTDPGNKAARMLGIAHDGGLPIGMEMFGYDQDTVLPTVIITDNNNRILWVDETNNYRVRPEPQLFLDVLQSSLSLQQPA